MTSAPSPLRTARPRPVPVISPRESFLSLLARRGMPPAQAARFADDIVAGRLTALACVDAEETAAATELRAAETGLPVWSVTFWPRFSDDGEPRRPFYRELAAPTADAARAEAEAWADDSEVTDVEATL